LARFLAELNAIHPFREGNGRTQLSFAGLIGAAFGQPLQLRRVSQRTFLPAMVSSFAGDLGPPVAELRRLRG
jgi:cell filamentation protein